MLRSNLRGITRYYANHASRREAAGFHAAMSMSFLCCIALASGITLPDYFLHGNIERSVVLFAPKFTLLLLGLAIAFSHVQFAKATGHYHTFVPPEPSPWRLYLCVYAAITILLFVGALVVAIYK